MMDLLPLLFALPIAIAIIVVYEIIDRRRQRQLREELLTEMSARGQLYIDANPDDPFVQALERAAYRS